MPEPSKSVLADAKRWNCSRVSGESRIGSWDSDRAAEVAVVDPVAGAGEDRGDGGRRTGVGPVLTTEIPAGQPR